MYIKMILLFAMIFCHIVDDYYLQGWLASAKQKSWWEKNAPDELYKNDYKMALCEHAFSWTFMVMLIPMIYMYFHQRLCVILVVLIFFVLNFVCHVIVDDAKANMKVINLVEDQCIHFVQVIITWIIFILVV